MSILRHIPYAALTAGSLLFGSGAYGQSMYSIDQRQAGQQDWIRHGIRDGQLTPGEAARLERGEQAINRAQARAEADGHVSSSERRRIDNMADRESHQIYHDEHNNRTASGGRDGWGRDHDGWRGRDGGDHRDADRRDWGRDHNWNGNHNGWDRSNASNRDWGRDHNWNGNHDGWNQANGQHGWNGGAPGQPGTQHSWNGTPGQGGWQHGGTPTGSTTPATGSANNNSHGWGGSWGGHQQGTQQQGPRMMPASAPASQSWTQTRTTTQSYQARNTGGSGGNYNGGRSFGHR
ncbi:MAG: hypothetical protein J0H44_26965 [Alphaproteobacteria bacterium]|nr:hypothetical protein [Alphaproteobacteria bacterium]